MSKMITKILSYTFRTTNVMTEIDLKQGLSYLYLFNIQ